MSARALRPWRAALARAACLAALALGACGRDTKPAPSVKPSAAPGPSTAAVPADLASLRFPAAPRIVAIGDLHGDLAATRAVLRLVGAIDEKDAWIGKDLVVVQTGDEVDRGDGDRPILELFDRLADEAKATGGAVHALNGNHEIMNVAGDFRYVSEGAFRDFANIERGAVPDPRLERFPEPFRPRAAAFLPGGRYAKLLAKRPIAAIVGDNVFVHGGVLPEHVPGLAKLDREVRAWMEGGAPGSRGPEAIHREDSPVWARRYSDDPGPRDCKALGEALAAMGAKRMVVGHTVQKRGIRPACDGRVQRIDVGMSAYYGTGHIEALEIVGSEVKVLRVKR